ncbi:SAM-dependent methyltransferase [Zoogloea sp.]|uniref:SAM-dependent methyltransferase n=1 Tax=Zoogloea sp. TaxID=49181 RepID=UPI0035B14111
MSDELNPAPLADLTDAAPPATRTAPTRSPRKKKSATPPAEAPAAASDADATDAQPKPRRAPRKPRVKKTEAPSGEVTADLFALTEGSLEAASEVVTEVAPEQVPLPPAPAVQALADPAPVPQPESEPLAVLVVAGEASGLADVESDDAHADFTPSEGDGPAGPRRKRKRRRGKGGADREAARGEQIEMPGLADGVAGQPEAVPLAEARVDAVAPLDTDALAAADPMPEEPAATPEPLPPLTVVSLGLELPPVLSAAALETLRAARVILGTADALDRLAGLGLDAPQQLCAADSAHMDVRAAGHAGSVLVVVGDGAGDGPALELLADLGPAYVRVLPGVGRVQAACAALGLSAEVVTVVDLRRAPLAALRGRLRAHCLFALPLADAAAPVAVARLLLDSGFSDARVWVCEFASGRLQARAWLASELVDLREAFDTHAVLILATGPSSGVFAELPGLSDAAFGDEADTALPLAARVLAMAWLQPAAWESGWAISQGEASLALEWARAVPTARVRAVGVEPTVLGVSMARAGVGDNLSAIPSASPLRSREWPVPEAVFIRGGVGLSDWLAAAWERLAPGGRLVATAEDDQARADLLAFAGQVPAAAWQELSLSRGETVAGRLRFAPSAPVRLALWCKPALS